MKPTSEAEVAEAISHAKVPFEIIGGGTRKIGQVEGGEPLYTAGLSGISLYEPEALTLVAKAGTPMVEIEATLAKHGQRLPFEPADLCAMKGTQGASTIGGVVATNASGPRRISAGACRDSLIGVRFVDGLGRVIKNGGRVMKNVTGYDVVKLMAGSHGTLGVITEVSFKLLPATEATATVIVREDEHRAAITMAKALASPYDVTGAAHASGETRLRVEGLTGSVGYRSEALSRLVNGQIGAFDWQAQRDVLAFADQPGDVWRISVKPSDGPILAAALRDLGAKDVILDWAGGLLWVRSPEGLDLRPAMPYGHATLVRGQGLRAFPPEPAAIAALSEALRQKFDPRQILNPGRMN